MCQLYKDLNKITEPMMSPDDIFPKLSGSQFFSTLVISVRVTGLFPWRKSLRIAQHLLHPKV